MKTSCLASVALLLTVILGSTPGFACGDKLLRLSRIYHHRGIEGGTVAVLSRPNSLLENFARLNAAKPFREAGYQLLIVTDVRDLELALNSGAANMVIADIADLASIQQIASAAKVPVVPVTRKNELSKAEARRFLATLQAPVKPGSMLDAVDRAFSSRVLREDRSQAMISRVSLH